MGPAQYCAVDNKPWAYFEASIRSTLCQEKQNKAEDYKGVAFVNVYIYISPDREKN